MRRPFSLGRVFGIRFDVHASWFVVYAFVTATIANAPPANGLPAVAAYALAAGAALALFGSVLVHELAHALTARAFGVQTRSIALFLFGGVATLEHEPPTPVADALVALAGPVVSAIVALGAFGAMREAAVLAPAADRVALVAFCAYVTVANAMLAGFNLIPAYPMDGGRVLRAAIWHLRGDRDGATATAALLGIGFAALFGIGGLVAAVATQTWQFAWYVVLAAFLLRQSFKQYRALRRPVVVVSAPIEVSPAA